MTSVSLARFHQPPNAAHVSLRRLCQLTVISQGTESTEASEAGNQVVVPSNWRLNYPLARAIVHLDVHALSLVLEF